MFIRWLTMLVLLLLGAPAAANTWCAGTASQPARRLEVTTSAAGAAPYVTLSPEDAEGAWLVDFGATASSVSRLGKLPASDPRWVGPDLKRIRLRNFDFPHASPTTEVLNLPRQISEDGVGVQHGVVGSDVLAQRAIEFHYEDPRDQHLLVSAPGCILANQGFFQILQAGYFGTKTQHYAAQGVNVPVVFAAFEYRDGTLAASLVPAQLDTGMADAVWPRTVYVNSALWAKIRTPGAVRVGTLEVTQCVGSASLPVWVLPDVKLQITDQTGYWMTKYPAFYVVPLDPASASSPCRGIATMSVPAAQLGASFLRSFGTVVVDAGAFPTGGAVWIRMPQAPTP